ncbi:ADP-heptose--lipooligosaccharide heptosyltransferase 2 [Desulfurella amilsii]|uniref:ADP-heptose--lipooligosaccharide heptosyltransferase 2 n=1 Tax=Desulfurella amilsii TaxID=1562698 RepID=A0A1X4XZR4_9BACT|nr:glycosyltransferase family 9 protein [Desulfurella amilsii]OSS43025.1 ADP-heptose--lipooligosaccharide heptosyltransferase 2 [Desulfurella amilsii]
MNFCIIRLSSLGDIVITTAFIVELKKIYPRSKIFYVTKGSFVDLFYNMPFVDKVVEYSQVSSIKHIKFDAIYDLQVNWRSLILALKLKGKIYKAPKHRLYRLKVLYKSRFPFSFVKNKKQKDIIEDYLGLIGKKDGLPKLICKKEKHEGLTIGIAPFAAWKNKMWETQNFTKLMVLLDKEFIHPSFFIFGSKDEKALAKDFDELTYRITNYVGNLRLSQLVEKIGSCDIFITNDSGLMHIASACNVPIVAIFGPTVKEFGFYPRTKSVIIEKQLECRPCHLHGGNVCRLGHFRCMRDINPEDVFLAVKSLLEEKDG